MPATPRDLVLGFVADDRVIASGTGRVPNEKSIVVLFIVPNGFVGVSQRRALSGSFA